ncbi:MAG: class I SAM-dependent methyltransferase [Steroidobacteraceae bacterium]|jgi:predicted O-methyltransferase YrrM
MSTWGKGYVTDVEYSDGFYPNQAAAHLSIAATIDGVAAPVLEDRFTYCELGCGRGKTSLVLAATHPEAEFHAIDFNPAHVAHAREQARLAGLDNIQFHECSFDELTGRRGEALPMFDVVTMHGVWTWVAPALQTAIVAFLNARLQAGGLLYVSYNVLPTWYQASPLQRLVKELSAAVPQRSDLAVSRAIEQLDRFVAAKIIPERFMYAAKRFKDVGNMLPYLVHEYLNEHWQPAYFADVARSLAEAKLNYAACAELLKNFYNLALTEEQRAAIAEISSPELRETLKDFCTDNWFRQDVFVRGLRRISVQHRDQLLSSKTLTLLRQAPDVFEVAKPDGSRWRPDPVVYGMILDALKQGPRTVGELLRLEGLPSAHLVAPVELVGTLIGTGLAGLAHTASPAELARADRLNALYESEADVALAHGAAIAVAAARSGISLTSASYALYRSLKRGESLAADVLAAQFIRRCRDRGAHPVIDEKVIEDPAEAQTAMTRDYEFKIEKVVPVWRMLGVV